MSTAIAILGGVGLLLLGMTVMTDGLKALAGSALRTVLGKATDTPLSGAFWGAIVTLLVQSSSTATSSALAAIGAGATAKRLTAAADQACPWPSFSTCLPSGTLCGTSQPK
jgi:Na+/phosphate symporter